MQIRWQSCQNREDKARQMAVEVKRGFFGIESLEGRGIPMFATNVGTVSKIFLFFVFFFKCYFGLRCSRNGLKSKTL